MITFVGQVVSLSNNHLDKVVLKLHHSALSQLNIDSSWTASAGSNCKSCNNFEFYFPIVAWSGASPAAP